MCFEFFYGIDGLGDEIVGFDDELFNRITE